MKTRIISGCVLGAIVLGILLAGFFISPLFITVFVAVLGAFGGYELVHNAAGVEKSFSFASSAFCALLIVALDKTIDSFLNKKVLISALDGGGHISSPFLYKMCELWNYAPYVLTVVYFLFSVIVILCRHGDFSLDKIAVFSAMPFFVAYSFSMLERIISGNDGVYYLLMLFTFSSVCDMGAYFVGVSCGKHKLCPEISPKKTVEGAVGGVLTSLIFVLIILICFKKFDKLAVSLLLTVPFCIIGMCGDLFASVIKRAVGIKDYGNLIPGHGGILDRFDSILLIAPVLYIFADSGVL